MGPVLCPVLVGREAELAILTDAVARARTGSGGVAAVVGEAGVGKSRLVGEVTAAAAAEGLRVLTGRAVDSGPPAPFRPLTEALLAGLRDAGPPDAPELDPFRPALGRLLPDLRGVAPTAADESLVVLGEGIVRLLRILAGAAGAVLVLEDLHWADTETLAVVTYLADHLPAAPVLCVVTMRATRTPALTAIRTLAARRSAALVELGRLGPGEVTTVAQACLGSPDLPGQITDWLRDRADGLPFLVEELLAAALASTALVRRDDTWAFAAPDQPLVPQSFADTVRRRLAVLGADGQAIVRAAAVLGRRFDWTLLPAVTNAAENAVREALRRAVDAQLLTAGPAEELGTYRFRHALTRDAVADELLPSERAAVARRALDIVEATHPDFPGAWCELAAHLSVEAGDAARAAALLLKVGSRALSSGALATAERTLDRARSLAPDDALEAEIDQVLVSVLALAGKTADVAKVGERLLSSLGRLRAPATAVAQVHLDLARAAAAATDWPRADRHVAAARHHADHTADGTLRARVAALAAHCAIGQARLDAAATLATNALAAAEHGGLDRPEMAVVACEALEVLGRRGRTRDFHEADTAFRRALRIAEDHGLPHWRIRALHELGSLDMLDTFRLDRLAEARDAAYREGAFAVAAFVELNLAAVLAQRMDLDGALAATRRGEDVARRFDLGLALPMAMVSQGCVHAVAPRREAAEEAVAQALALAGDDPNISAGSWGQVRAELSLVAEDRARALEELDVAMGYVRQPGTGLWPFRGMWALLCTLEDRDGEAARAELRRSPGMVARINRAYVTYADAVAAGRRGDPDGAADTFAAAERVMDGLAGAVWLRHRAHRLVAEAALTDGWGEPVRWLRQTVATFDASGHAQLASACRSLLRKAGAPVPRLTDAGIPADLRAHGVTSRESEVLGLLGERLTNREIASRLYLSPRTVEKHVERLLHKTGARDRRALAALARRAGVPAP